MNSASHSSLLIAGFYKKEPFFYFTIGSFLSALIIVKAIECDKESLAGTFRQGSMFFLGSSAVLFPDRRFR